MDSPPEDTTHQDTVRAMADGWHLLHAIHRKLRSMREGGPLTRDYAIESTRANAETLWRLHVYKDAPPALAKRATLEASHLATVMRELAPPPTQAERAALTSAYRHLLGVGAGR